ncbi:tetratricopeptide repeat protein [Methylomonas sp. MED-D]|uniref:tetratricopeptide repeat protein n=1 Tax=unclassified Methylomonas TaxID=2608980 RepID=UPI0028A47F8F|nr:tetratricopeptide repeat protein [Methylomonas sp. MV1]MDT4328616.1 hypothetical protein [Methylomonas sp. MV1]
MSDNYDEETRPLFKLLRTEAFRFIIVRYNHFSLLQQLKQDLQSRFPERPFLSLNTAQTDYSQVSQSYFQLGSGFLLLEQFEDALKQQANPEQRPDIEQNNQRRRDLCAGLNLRRDKLAQYLIALIVCIQGADHELYAKSLMEKMPDLWSFRSYMLDLHQPIQPPTEAMIGGEPTGFTDDIRVDTDAPDAELKRLQSLLANAPEREYDYRRSLYPQLVSLAIDSGAYAIAEQALAEWQVIATNQDLAQVFGYRGDLSVIRGDFPHAKAAFEQALMFSLQQGDQFNEAVTYQRLGDVSTSIGDLQQALAYYQRAAELCVKLDAVYTSNVEFRSGLASCYCKLGDTYTALGNLDKALEFYQMFHGLIQALFGKHPSNIDLKNGLAIAYEKLGQTLSALGDLHQALGHYEKRRDLAEQLNDNYPNNVGFKSGLAIAYEKLGKTQAALGDLPEALRYFQEEEKLLEQLNASYPSNVGFKNGLAIAFEKLGQTFDALGNLQQAVRYFEKRRDLSEKLCSTYPSDVSFKSGLANGYANLAQFSRDRLNDPATAIDYFRQAEALWQTLVRDAPQYAVFQKNLLWVRNELQTLNTAD